MNNFYLQRQKPALAIPTHVHFRVPLPVRSRAYQVDEDEPALVAEGADVPARGERHARDKGQEGGEDEHHHQRVQTREHAHRAREVQRHAQPLGARVHAGRVHVHVVRHVHVDAEIERGGSSAVGAGTGRVGHGGRDGQGDGSQDEVQRAAVLQTRVGRNGKLVTQLLAAVNQTLKGDCNVLIRLRGGDGQRVQEVSTADDSATN